MAKYINKQMYLMLKIAESVQVVVNKKKKVHGNIHVNIH